MSNPYDYENRSGVRSISWNDMHGLCRALVKAAAAYQPEIILPIGRGGYFPGTLIAYMLRAEVYPVRVSRRVQDVVVHQEPQWLVRPPEHLAGRRLLLVDEISSTGGTLQMVKAELLKLGAAEVRCAVLYAHASGADIPDYIGLMSDQLLLNPWDREFFQEGEFVAHPEYAGALADQGLTVEPSFFIPAPEFRLAKG